MKEYLAKKLLKPPIYQIREFILGLYGEDGVVGGNVHLEKGHYMRITSFFISGGHKIESILVSGSSSRLRFIVNGSEIALDNWEFLWITLLLKKLGKDIEGELESKKEVERKRELKKNREDLIKLFCEEE